MHRILRGLEGVVYIMDDIVVFGSAAEEHDKRLENVLQKLTEAGVTLNQAKCMFRVPEMTFAGHVIGQNGIKVDPAKVEAIAQLPQPRNIQELRRFMGMVNHLGKFLPDLATHSEPLRQLLSPKNDWCWSPMQESAFQKIKKLICSAPVLMLYDPSSEIKVSADSSSYGLGAVIRQKDSNDEWKPVAYASRSLTPAETRYAQIEKEALASTWACGRFEDFLIGVCFTLETDHKPLIALLGSKSLDELPPRIQRMRMRLMRFSYNIKYVPGTNLYIADMLSRAPSSQNQRSEVDVLCEETSAYVNLVVNNLPASDVRLQQIRDHQLEDELCRQLCMYVESGWPAKSKLTSLLQQYWSHQADLTIVQGLLLYRTRIFVPSSLRLEMLDRIHEGHQGIVKCRQRAAQSVWWPGVSRQIEDLVKSCRICNKAVLNPKEPLCPSALPVRPWQNVATDLYEFQKSHYLLVVDYYSRFIEIAKLGDLTSATTITHLKSFFARHGVPENVLSDNGGQYISDEFATFARDYGFQHTTMSPLHPSGNGEVERAVRTLKSFLNSAVDPYAALLCYRSTPLACGFSPAELLFNRRIRSKIPMVPDKLKPEIPDRHILQEKEDHMRSQSKVNFDKSHRARILPQLSPGQEVYLPDRNETGIVDDKVHERSYTVNTPTGCFRRNRGHINNLPETDSTQEPSSPVTDSTTTTTVVNEPDVNESGLYITRSGRVSKPNAKYVDS